MKRFQLTVTDTESKETETKSFRLISQLTNYCLTYDEIPVSMAILSRHLKLGNHSFMRGVYKFDVEKMQRKNRKCNTCSFTFLPRTGRHFKCPNCGSHFTKEISN